ncbi:MAG: hypothetical protein ACJ73L_09740 [Actinomycetes bacterium]
MTLGTGMELRTGPPAHVALLANSGTNGLKKTVTTGPLNQLTLYAWAKQACTAWPVAQVFVDGVRVGGTGVTVNTTSSSASPSPASLHWEPVVEDGEVVGVI